MATATTPSQLSNPSDPPAAADRINPLPEDASSALSLPLFEEESESNPAAVGEPVTDLQKKAKRAARFGMPVHLSEEEKRNSRAERFGTEELDSSKQSEELRKKARAERFGIVQASSTEEEAKKKARIARFGSVPVADAAEEAKKKARALRFSSGSMPDGKGVIQAETAIASKDGGGA